MEVLKLIVGGIAKVIKFVFVWFILLPERLFWQVWLPIINSLIITTATAITALLIMVIAMADGITAMVIKAVANVEAMAVHPVARIEIET